MADVGKPEEGNARGEKRKLDQPNSGRETFEQKPEVKDPESEADKRQKVEAAPENEVDVVHGEMAETGTAEEDPKNAEGGDEDQHFIAEVAMVERRRYTAEEKCKAVLIEESDEEESDYYDDDEESSSDNDDGDFSAGLDTEPEDIQV